MPKKKISPVLAGTNGKLMVMAAHRYCLGRQTYIVGSCIDWMKTWWCHFDTNTKNVMLRDTIEYLMDGIAGSAFDAMAWREFAKWGWDQIGKADKEWIEQAVAHKQKEWPL